MGTAHALPDPFFVLATQNPIELEGTYPLPEAQLDRFLFKLEVAPGGVEVLTKIVQNREIGVEPVVQQVLDRAGLLNLMGAVQRVYLADVVANFIARLVAATHPGGSKSATGVRFGASPRAALALAAGSRARALVHGRPTASFEDVAALAPLVFGHRVLLDYSARMDGKTSRSIVGDILQEIKPVDMHLPPTMELRS
jgi:MoxR-like ATPase